ncbi:MAG: alpha/beta fold hydrolase [Geodermatophilaceae bacterium]
MRHAVRRLLPVLLLGPVLAVGLAAPALAQPTSTGAGVPRPGCRSRDCRGSSPPGANDFSCTPDAAHPYPVVLVHGTFADAYGSWLSLSPQLAAEGYCVFALDYGRNATIAIERSAGQLADFVDRVLEATGAAKVSLVGHSQGGLMPRYYLRFLGGAALVDELIGLAPSNHGTTVPILPGTGLLCRACVAAAGGLGVPHRAERRPRGGARRGLHRAGHPL